MPPPALPRPDQPPSYSTLIRFAIPVMLAAIATPLMGLVDTAVLGRLGNPALIAASGIGGTIFTVIYWCFSFLRFTTTGLVAQAVGRQDDTEVALAGLRPMLAAVTGGIGLWLLQWPIGHVALWLLAPPAEVTSFARLYFDARIWSAPFTLLGYAQFAWLMGLGRSRSVMLLQLAMNALNAGLSVLFVLGFGWGIAGAAWATVLSEAVIGIATSLLILRIVPWHRWRAALGKSFVASAWQRLFSANLDIMIRTLLLTGAFALMTQRGAQLGTLELAANQILLQAFMVCANLLDGFATAAEVHGARAIGAKARAALVVTVQRNAWLSLAWSLILAAALAASAHAFMPLMSTDPALRHEALRFWPWLVAMPLVCIWAFFWDGVFMGAVQTRTLRNAMIASFVVYVPALFGLSTWLGNHGIWAALVILMAMRSLMLTLAWPKLKASVSEVRV
ncbi:MATE family efflux transporter [Crenobacter sp. SG2303]|uniref:MATE family efflux transporter n=1 Tax=Crenobacter oryzisoli TaxID=3056844 RepID=A0ABT7XJS2_9NEIS|nr:MATE family efflux transporter [Crenobacter sp. SG2303]MDN0074042.1 MATE family efflux transporter [Crenobacter sp. SG2303]